MSKLFLLKAKTTNVGGEGANLVRIEYIDFGTNQAGIFSAVASDEVDIVYETIGDFITILDNLGLPKTEAVTANTVVIRANQPAELTGAAPYADARVRRALALAIDNTIILELGFNNKGLVGESHHVSPLHPEYAELPTRVYDPEAAVAVMLGNGGINVKRTVTSGATFWNDRTRYNLSTTDWAQRPLGVQVLALAYKSCKP